MKSDLSVSLARIEERLAHLERIVYAEKAAELGYQDFPVSRISTVALHKPTQQHIEGKTSENIPYHLEIRIRELTKNRIAYSIDGEVGTNRLEAISLSHTLEIGVPLNLTRTFEMLGMPDIWLTVLDFPTEDTAVLAIGPRSPTTS